MTTLTAAPVKTITYDRLTGDYKMELDGEFVGYAACYHSAEIDLDRLAFEQIDRAGVEPELLQSATALDGGSSPDVIAAEYAAALPAVTLADVHRRLIAEPAARAADISNPFDDPRTDEERRWDEEGWTECEGGWEKFGPHPFDASRTVRHFRRRLFTTCEQYSTPPLGACRICGAAAWRNAGPSGLLCPSHAGVLDEHERSENEVLIMASLDSQIEQARGYPPRTIADWRPAITACERYSTSPVTSDVPRDAWGEPIPAWLLAPLEAAPPSEPEHDPCAKLRTAVADLLGLIDRELPQFADIVVVQAARAALGSNGPQSPSVVCPGCGAPLPGVTLGMCSACLRADEAACYDQEWSG